MSFVAESPGYGGNIYALAVDDTHVFAGGGYPVYAVRKYLKSDISFVATSDSYGGDVRAIVLSSGAGGDAPEWAGIYQMRSCHEGKIPIRMKFYAPPETPARIANPRRAICADGVSAWKLLTDEQKAEYDKRAIGRHYGGYHLFMREYLLSH